MVSNDFPVMFLTSYQNLAVEMRLYTVRKSRHGERGLGQQHKGEGKLHSF
jgi:hypothetical protein